MKMKLVTAGSTRRLAKLYILAGLLAVGLLLLAVSAPQAGANDPHRAGLVIDYGGEVKTFCVSFSENSITGLDVLKQAGRQLELGFGGGTVCKIDGVGCPGNDCWCKCRNSSSGCTYWIYWHLVEGKWVYSSRGAAGYQVHDRDVEGWIWGSGDPNGGGQPPVYTIDQICQLLPLQTDTPTVTDTPTPTHTPVPSDTPTVTDTPTPTHTPVPSNTATVTNTPMLTRIPVLSNTPTATDTPAPINTPEISFRADATELVAGSCTTLRWDVEDVQEVYLDDQGVIGQETKQVCPAHTQTYELLVISAAGEFREQVTVNVVQSSPTPIPSDKPTSLPTGAPVSTDTSQPQPEVPSPTLIQSLAEAPPLTATPLLTYTATPTPNPSAVAMVAPPTAPSKEETDASSEADQPVKIPLTKVTVLNWLLFLAATVLSALCFGGMAFVGILALLGVLYLLGRSSQEEDYSYRGGDDVDAYH